MVAKYNMRGRFNESNHPHLSGKAAVPEQIKTNPPIKKNELEPEVWKENWQDKVSRYLLCTLLVPAEAALYMHVDHRPIDSYEGRGRPPPGQYTPALWATTACPEDAK